jgi:hypothetical protein
MATREASKCQLLDIGNKTSMPQLEQKRWSGKCLYRTLTPAGVNGWRRPLTLISNQEICNKL